MSIPRIPGYSNSGGGENLAELWQKPDGDFPEHLWPLDQLQIITLGPTEWIVLEEQTDSVDAHSRKHALLIPVGSEGELLELTEWVGHGLGVFSAFYSGDGEDAYFDGLTSRDGEISTDFFVQVRLAEGSPSPQLEVSLPYLWFWDAYRTPSGWSYVNAAGRERELIRSSVDDQEWQVEFRVQELRTFLNSCQKTAVIQVHHVAASPEIDFNRVDDVFRNEWAHFDFAVVPDELIGRHNTSYSLLHGQYVVEGRTTARVPHWFESEIEVEYPGFIYGVDPNTGDNLIHTCDRRELGTYFDGDASRLHYLTPIYFDRKVLLDYDAEPARYTLADSQLTCLRLWSVPFSINTAGLVEVYLGDIGTRIPPEEWGHWRKYNVPPEGHMDEGRFRRDFLNQFASSPDPVGDMRRALEAANRASRECLGEPLWRPLPRDLALQFRSLIGPLTDDKVALQAPVLVLTKALVDTIDVGVLKARLREVSGVDSNHKNEFSLSLLRKLLEHLGDQSDCSAPLRDVQALRSRGGIAHVSNSDSERVVERLGIGDLGPREAFEVVVVRLTGALDGIAAVFAVASGTKGGKAP